MEVNDENFELIFLTYDLIYSSYLWIINEQMHHSSIGNQ